MSISPKLYRILKKIHLYACLSTVALLIMYVLTSYMMIHHDLFPSEGGTKTTQTIEVNPEEITNDNWQNFLSKNEVSGRLNNERINADGDKILQYANASSNTNIKIFAHGESVEITKNNKNKAHAIIGLHRQRGYGGTLPYNLYALLLDLVGLSLVIFTITGVIMWLKILDNNIWAWGILIAGAIYYSLVMIRLFIG